MPASVSHDETAVGRHGQGNWREDFVRDDEVGELWWRVAGLCATHLHRERGEYQR
jgi:hypothetical protein